MTVKRLFLIGLIAALLPGCELPDKKRPDNADILRHEAIAELQLNLRTMPKLVKVHAAEFLLWLRLDTNNEVYTIFTEENKNHQRESLYRIPLWRVLAQSETDTAKKNGWINKILKVWLDTPAIDRAQAAESLSKLKVSLLHFYPEQARQVIAGDPSPLSVYSMWSASNGLADDSIRSNRSAFLKLIARENDHVKAVAAYSLRHLGKLTAAEWQLLSEAALAKLNQPEFQVYLLSSAFVTAPADSVPTARYSEIRKRLLENKVSGRKDDRMELAAALSVRGGNQDIPLLDSLLHNRYPAITGTDSVAGNADIRSVAACAILKIQRRMEENHQ